MPKTFISKVTASSSSSLSFTSGIDSTYRAYEFHFINLHPSIDGGTLYWQANAVGQTGFNESITNTFFMAYHNESGTNTYLAYTPSYDQNNSTAYSQIGNNIGNDNDQSLSGIFTLYTPSSTTYLKHFQCFVNEYHESDYSIHMVQAGYINTTSAIDEIDFKFDTGTIDDGTIKMYGVS